MYEARLVLEPPAARRLAEHGTERDHLALHEELGLAAAASTGREAFGLGTVRFHRRVVELSGNRTLAAVVAMLGEVMARHVAHAYRESRSPQDKMTERHHRVLQTYARLVALVTERRGDEAELLWLRHMRAAEPYMLGGAAGQTQVVDLLH
ncbi:FCD domain-containing protein [Amycolatopsis acidiphila]|nr:FCD domain-containing protein [Amycolatopsis acidiphila]